MDALWIDITRGTKEKEKEAVTSNQLTMLCIYDRTTCARIHIAKVRYRVIETHALLWYA